MFVTEYLSFPPPQPRVDIKVFISTAKRTILKKIDFSTIVSIVIGIRRVK